MKIKNENQGRPKLLKISEGQYEIIGGTEEDIQAAKQWANFWGHQIVARPKCRSPRFRIPPLLKYQRRAHFARRLG
ncbi:MAG TPA: hypothetical protein VMF08_21720 [Candidatus Sulfotelmatobacter sp.]|nr:hypothetical protein [Candidatus Sulfotelmatobacter sp.]